ncbi:D-alanyl-D-alanine carboxypeptidase [Aurantimonas sp. Leaf443]|nr:D-alanyl-D-alanine carboxypeptidase [Aurantimonas sp. Leaf443]
MDANNGRVLYQEDADALRYPASLTKMMTLYLTFDALKSRQISLSSRMPVSAYAASRPPSKLGLKVGSTISVEDGIKALVTKSANDASVVLGEFLAGSEKAFAERMTQTARRIGMSRTTFQNANGLPNDAQKTTARDMATLGIALREHFPEYYPYFSTRVYTFNGQRIGNHNRVLNRVEGVDGIKTGYIRASGFNLVSSVVRGDKKLVAVVMGGRSGRSRDDHMVELLNRYLPQASGREGGPLIAARSGRSQVVAALSAAPKPELRPRSQASIEDRIASAYGSEPMPAMQMPVPAERPVVGRDAIRAALVEERPTARLMVPAAQILSEPQSASAFPTPRAAIPAGRDFDPETTGSVRTASVAGRSGWVVQIAAAPTESQAMAILAKAKAKAGGPLAHAEPFTQAVGSGSQTLHRARFAGFADKAEAWDACAALKRNDFSCYAVAN